MNDDKTAPDTLQLHPDFARMAAGISKGRRSAEDITYIRAAERVVEAAGAG